MKDPDFRNFLRDQLDDLSDAVINERSEDVDAICSVIHRQLEEILEAAADELEAKARREIGKRPHNDEEYDTSEDEDAEEILETRAEADLVLSEQYGLDFSDFADDFNKLRWLPKEEAIKMVAFLSAKL